LGSKHHKEALVCLCPDIGSALWICDGPDVEPACCLTVPGVIACRHGCSGLRYPTSQGLNRYLLFLLFFGLYSPAGRLFRVRCAARKHKRAELVVSKLDTGRQNLQELSSAMYERPRGVSRIRPALPRPRPAESAAIGPSQPCPSKPARSVLSTTDKTGPNPFLAPLPARGRTSLGVPRSP
jgi:hypothetical protein